MLIDYDHRLMLFSRSEALEAGKSTFKNCNIYLKAKPEQNVNNKKI